MIQETVILLLFPIKALIHINITCLAKINKPFSIPDSRKLFILQNNRTKNEKLNINLQTTIINDIKVLIILL